MRLSEGDVVSERFRVVRLLDSGGMGSVYVAEHRILKKTVALKIMSTPPTPSAVERFVQEGTAAAQVQHPGIVQVFDAGMHGRYPWLAMELLEGESLSARLDRGVLEVGEAADIAIRTLEALGAAHRAGVVHRDVKPSNIFLERTPSGPRPRLLDFGIAKDLARETRLTMTGAVLGTLGYLAPEQAVDSSRAEPRTDLYAMGAVLFHCLSGSTPYDAGSIGELVMAMVSGPPPDVRARAPRTPPPLASLIQRCLSQEPGARPASAEAMIVELRPFAHATSPFAPTLATAPPASVPPTASTPAWGGVTPRAPVAQPPPPRRGLGRGAIGCLVAGLLAVAVGAISIPFIGGALLAAITANPGIVTGEHLQWDSRGRPLFAAVNGDDAPDVVGVVSRIRVPDISHHAAAFDGRTGELLWMDEAPLGTEGRRVLAVVGDTLLLADPDAHLTAWSVAEGDRRWQRSTPALVDQICGVPPSATVIVLESGQRMSLDPTDGSTVPFEGDAPCARIDSMFGIGGWGVGVSGAHPAPDEERAIEAPGFRASAAFVAGAERLAVGAGAGRQPMVGLFREGQPRWLRTLADQHQGAPDAIALTGDAVFATYQDAQQLQHLVGLDRADGQRRFDVALPEESVQAIRSVRVVGATVWVSHWTWLDAFDARTGAQRFRIGRYR